MVEVTIEGVSRIQFTEIDEYFLDEGEQEEGEDLYYRRATIETESGALEIEPSAESRQALEVITSA